ncbi:MAG: LamG domain-containing protein [Deltaproteobacteria bacterium]|nr:LamG domain-containing protein [Deltaproteobacteria bacterium]
MATTEGSAPLLVDGEVLSRWFIDEASGGQVSEQLLDSVEPGLDLSVAVLGGYPQFVENLEGNRGLQWVVDGRVGWAESPTLDAGLIDELTHSTTLTIEMVFQFTQVTGGVVRLMSLGDGTTVDVGIAAHSTDAVELWWGDEPVAEIPVAGVIGARHVLHAVIDTAETGGAQVRGYLDGELLAVSPTGMLAIGSGAPLGAAPRLSLGDAQGDGGRFRGRIYYLALYRNALDGDEVTNNVDALLVSDDRP